MHWLEKSMALWQKYSGHIRNGSITSILRNGIFKSILMGLSKPSYGACVKTREPVLFCNRKLVKLKYGETVGKSLFWRKKVLYQTVMNAHHKGYGTYSGTSVRRKKY